MLPENLTELDLAALRALATAIKASSSQLSIENDFDKLSTLSDEYDQVDALIAEKVAAEAAHAEKIEKINSNLFSTKEETHDEDVVEDIEDDTEMVEDDSMDSEEGSVEGASMAADDTAEVAVDGTAEVVADAAAEASVEDDTPEDGIVDDVSTASQKAAGMNRHLPEGRKASLQTSKAGNDFVASRALAAKSGGAFEAGEHVDLSQIAAAASSLRGGFGNITGYEEQVLATAQIPGASLLSEMGDLEGNYKALKTVANAGQALVASGAPCLAPENDYSFYRLSDVHRPIEEAMPVMLAPEGAFRFIMPVDWAYLSGGISSKTCADEAADPYVPKSVIEVECPDYTECCVTSVSQIIQFNNLTHRAFPTFVEEAMYQMGVAFAEFKEKMYLDEIDAASVSINAAAAGAIGGTGSYDSPRNVAYRVIQNAVAYRKRHRMSMDASLQVILPDFLEHMNMVSGLMDARLNDIKGAFEMAMDEANIDIIWTYYLPTGATAAQGQSLFDPQADAAAMNSWATEINAYMFAPGTFVRMDTGQLDLGIVRDSVLNRNNDLHIFNEQWTKLCKVGYEVDKFPVAVCPNGGGAGDVAPIAC